MKYNPIFENFKFMSGPPESFEADEYLVFVLMPFGKDKKSLKYFSGEYSVIKDIVENACFHGGKLKCSRADRESGLIIMSDICENVKRAGLLIFDISRANPNVYFELGLACSLDKKVLLLYNPQLNDGRKIDESLPFDIAQFRHIKYDDFDDLRVKIKPQIERLVELNDSFNSDIAKVFEKVKRISRHLNLDSKADIIREDNDITDFEIEQVCNIIDEYRNNPDLESERSIYVRYDEVERKIRSRLSMRGWSRAKELLRFLYWSGHYQELIAKMQFLPSELSDVKQDWKERHTNER